MTTLDPRQGRDHRAARDRGEVRLAARRRQDQPAPGRALPDGGRAADPRRGRGRVGARARVARRDAGRGTPAATAPSRPKRGFVVFVDTDRASSIDLTAADGCSRARVVSLRRDRIPIVHPVTGEVLGELDEEVATARVTEIRDRFSVAEVQTVAPGSQIQVKDRVVPK